MSEPSKQSDDTLREKLAKVRLAVFDVDGTLTEGRVTYVDRLEQQSFSARDGYGLAQLKKAGIAQVWITGRGSRPTRQRAKELGVEKLLMGVKDKTKALREVQAKLGITPEETLAMGDDLQDLQMKPLAEIFAAPSDAAREVLDCADIITNAFGGRGAAREVCEQILAARGAWPETKA